MRLWCKDLGIPTSNPKGVTFMLKKVIGSLALLAGLVLCVGSANAGVVPGPQHAYGTVAAGSSNSYVLNLRGGTQARIAVSGDGDTDLDCYLYDQNGSEVDRDDDSTDECRLVNTPLWTGPFQLVIKNRGSVYNEFELRTN